LTLLILRRPTRDYSNQRAAENATEANGFTLAEALRTPAFWAFAGAGAAFNMVSSGLGLFNESVLNERGFDQKTFHDFLVFTTLISLAGQFGCGWLSRRFSYQTLTCLALLLYGFGLGLIPLVTQHWQLWGLAVLIGASGGMIMVVFFSVWSDVFGQHHLGRIQGAAQMLTVISSGLGPLLFAKGATLSGSYAPLLWTLSILAIVLALLVRGVRTPETRALPNG
jgi:MFS family permease